MSFIKVGIVEDEFIIAYSIADALKELGYEITSIASNYTEALDVIANEKPDIMLIDIQLGGYKDGIDLAWRVRKDYTIPFIFLTSNTDAATVERAKKVSPNAYLVKPYNKHDLYTSIEICVHNYASMHKQQPVVTEGNYLINDSVFIKNGQYFNKIKIQDILYIESDNNYINVHLADSKMMVRSNLQDYLELLASRNFFRVHRSFAVNLQHVETINSEFLLVNNFKIPIGKAYRDELLTLIKIS